TRTKGPTPGLYGQQQKTRGENVGRISSRGGNSIPPDKNRSPAPACRVRLRLPAVEVQRPALRACEADTSQPRSIFVGGLEGFSTPGSACERGVDPSAPDVFTPCFQNAELSRGTDR